MLLDFNIEDYNDDFELLPSDEVVAKCTKVEKNENKNGIEFVEFSMTIVKDSKNMKAGREFVAGFIYKHPTSEMATKIGKTAIASLWKACFLETGKPNAKDVINKIVKVVIDRREDKNEKGKFYQTFKFLPNKESAPTQAPESAEKPDWAK